MMTATIEKAIAERAQEIANLLTEEVTLFLKRLHEAEQEALARISQIAPIEYDYDAAAAYLSISRRTLEARVAQRAIKIRRDGKRVFFTQGALDEYKATLTIPARERRNVSL